VVGAEFLCPPLPQRLTWRCCWWSLSYRKKGENSLDTLLLFISSVRMSGETVGKKCCWSAVPADAR